MASLEPEGSTALPFRPDDGTLQFKFSSLLQSGWRQSRRPYEDGKADGLFKAGAPRDPNLIGNSRNDLALSYGRNSINGKERLKRRLMGEAFNSLKRANYSGPDSADEVPEQYSVVRSPYSEDCR